MHQVCPAKLWIGNGGDLRGPVIEQAGIRAVVHLAIDERMPDLSRELLLIHVPLMDGAGNPPELLRFALETTAGLLRATVPTLVCCSNGMSRSPCLAAAAIAVVEECAAAEALDQIIRNRPHVVSPALWEAVCQTIENCRKESDVD